VSQQQYRWSGLAGIAGGALFIFVLVFVGVIVGADASISAFPDVRAGRTVENTLYLAVVLMWIAPFLALGRALHEMSPAGALYGSVLGVLGLGVLAAGALPHVASVPIADLYHAPGSDLETLAAAWQVNQGIMNMLLVTGLAILPVGVVGLGMAMLGAPGFGTRIGRVSITLGLVGIAAAVVLLVDPLSPVAVIGFLALIAFNVVVGWRLYSLSRGRVERTAPTAMVTGRSAG
jgi:hypothetical protein